MLVPQVLQLGELGIGDVGAALLELFPALAESGTGLLRVFDGLITLASSAVSVFGLGEHGTCSSSV